MSEELLKKYSCNSPFKYTDIQPSGMFVCCPAWNTINLRVDENGNENLYKPVEENEDVERNWLSKQAKDIRRSILDGTYSTCNKIVCPSLSQLINGLQVSGVESIPYNFQPTDELMKEFNLESIDDVDKFTETP